MNTNIEFKDFEETTVRKEQEARKIKFKQSSFGIIYNKFKDFLKRKLVNFVDRKLEEAKRDLVNVEFKRGDNLVNFDGTTNKEKILKKKTESIDRMTKILNFLERGNYKKVPAPGEEDSRPLRLRKIMEDGLRKNVYNIEKIDDSQKDEVMSQINEVVNDTKKSIEEETTILNNKIDNFRAGLPYPVEEKVQENFENIKVEDVRESVEDSFNDEQNKEQEITTNDIVAEVDNTFEKVEENSLPEENAEKEADNSVEEEKEKPITYEDVQKQIGETFESENNVVSEITPIKSIEKRKIGEIKKLPDIFEKTKEEDKEDKEETEINNNVENKEEVIRENPVIVPDREEEQIKEKEEFKEAQEVYDSILKGLNSEEENTEKVEETDEKIYEEESTIPEEDVEEKEESVTEDKKEEIKEIPDEENIGFDFSEASIEDIKKAAETTNNQKDLTAMMLKIRMLKKEEENTKQQIEKAREEAAAKEAKLQETYKMFDDYCNELEAKCNKNLQEKEEIINKSREKDEVINKMLSAMEMTETNNSKKKK